MKPVQDQQEALFRAAIQLVQGRFLDILQLGIFLALISPGFAAQALSAPAPITLERRYLPGDVLRKRDMSTIRAPGRPAGKETLTVQTEVHQVKVDGEVVLVTRVPDGTTITETRDRWNRLVGWDHPGTSNLGMPETIRRTLFALSEIVLPRVPVAEGESWDTTLDDPAAPGTLITYRTTFLGTETLDGAARWKLQQNATAADGHGGVMTGTVTCWLDPQNGQMAKSVSSVAGIPAGPVRLTYDSEQARLGAEPRATAGNRDAQELFFDSGGVKIHYFIEGKGPPILLIHGFAGDAGFWRASGMVDALRPHHRVIAFDLRGFGSSDKPHDPRQYGGELAEDAVRLLDHLKIRKAHVVGYSMGASVVSALLIVHPDRLLTATLGGGGPLDPSSAPFFENLAESIDKGQGVGPLLETFVPPGHPRPDQAQLAEMSKQFLAGRDPGSLAALFRSVRLIHLDPAALNTNRVPTLALVGENDGAKREVAGLKDRVGHLQIDIIPETDHNTTPMSPEFVRRVISFVDQAK
jgi:pimeloyl-ACP methyl ester carboxylesterase